MSLLDPVASASEARSTSVTFTPCRLAARAVAAPTTPPPMTTTSTCSDALLCDETNLVYDRTVRMYTEALAGEAPAAPDREEGPRRRATGNARRLLLLQTTLRLIADEG